MKSLTEVELPLLPVEQPAFAADPAPFVEAARREHSWLAKSNVGGYVVHGYQAVKDILYMDDKLRPYFDGVAEFYGAEETAWGRFMSEMMIARRGPDHARLRASAQATFTPRNVNRYRELMRRVISDLLDEWAPTGKFDFADFASYFPITVFCGLLGVSPEIVPRIRDALETQAASTTFNRDVLAAMLGGFETLWSFADSAVLERERSGAGEDGLLDAMIAAKAAGKIDDIEIRQNLIMFATAGYDTSKNMLSLIVYLMLQHPDYWRRCAEDIGFCGKVVQESLRHSSIASVYRAVSKEFEYGGICFPEGTAAFLHDGFGRARSVGLSRADAVRAGKDQCPSAHGFRSRGPFLHRPASRPRSTRGGRARHRPAASQAESGGRDHMAALPRNLGLAHAPDTVRARGALEGVDRRLHGQDRDEPRPQNL